MDNQEISKAEKEPSYEYRLLSDKEKEQYKDQIEVVLKEYPDQFFPEYLDMGALKDYKTHEIVCALQNGQPIGCLFFDRKTKECNWLAISHDIDGSKREVATKLFETVFNSVPRGTRVWWHVNTEDAAFEGKSVGQHFEPARKLYRNMGATLTRKENVLGEGNHAYLVEITT